MSPRTRRLVLGAAGVAPLAVAAWTLGGLGAEGARVARVTRGDLARFLCGSFDRPRRDVRVS